MYVMDVSRLWAYPCILCPSPCVLAVLNTQVPSEMVQYVTRLVNTFGVGQEQQGGLGTLSGQPVHEVVSKRASQDPAFLRLKTQFTTDFDFR